MPEVMVALLYSVLADRAAVEEVLSQDWVSEWNVWSELDEWDDRSCMDVARRLLQISTAVRPVASRTNVVRIQELEREGLRLVRASPHEANNCLLDALLLTLVHAGFLPQFLSSNEAARRDRCAVCRATLVHASDERLRPRCRSPRTNAVLPVSAAEHASAFLQHEIHGPAVVKFLLREAYHDASHVGSVRITVFTRFDCDALDPEALSLRVPLVSREAFPEPVLRLFCHMDSVGGGYHYDALVGGIAAGAAVLPTAGEGGACSSAVAGAEDRMDVSSDKDVVDAVFSRRTP